MALGQNCPDAKLGVPQVKSMPWSVQIRSQCLGHKIISCTYSTSVFVINDFFKTGFKKVASSYHMQML